MKKPACLLLTALLLAACDSAPVSDKPLIEESPEKQAMAFFSNNCIATAADAKRLKAKLSKELKPAAMRKLTSEKLAVLKPVNDEIVAGWEVLTPSNQHYAITVTKKHTCMLTATHMDEQALHVEFLNVVDALAQQFKTDPERGPHPDTGARAIDAYHINLPNSTTGPELTLIQLHDQSHLAMIMFQPLTTQP